MDKLEIKQGSFIQQTQYFIPVEIDLSVVPARLGIWFFSMSDVSFHWYRTNVNVEAWYRGKCFLTHQIPTSCLPKGRGIISEHYSSSWFFLGLRRFNVHICNIYFLFLFLFVLVLFKIHHLFIRLTCLCWT